ncbi:hypothetical protein SMD22_01310 (plasmid) [Brevibacillus halotolerans]|nr:hypothetical protein SMD22_01310 [Brevibacillus halotolerans]
MSKWQSNNSTAPEAVIQAVRHYRRELINAIKEMQNPEFEVYDRVELISSSYEDAGLFSGATGKVIDVKSDVLSSDPVKCDIRVEWDNGCETCWISGEDFAKY